jgi:hypothetical protein
MSKGENFYTTFKTLLKKYFGISIAEWHSIAFGGIMAILGGVSHFMPVMAYILSDAPLKGHLKDIRKEVIYGLASFGVVELIQIHVLGVFL